MFGLSTATIAACTVAALAITTAIMPAGVNARIGKDQTRLDRTIESPVSSRVLMARAPNSADGCLMMTERKLRADGGYDVNQFRMCE